jgi:hypothetical protein
MLVFHFISFSSFGKDARPKSKKHYVVCGWRRRSHSRESEAGIHPRRRKGPLTAYRPILAVQRSNKTKAKGQERQVKTKAKTINYTI